MLSREEKSFNSLNYEEIVFEPFGFEHPIIIVPIPEGEKLPFFLFFP